MIIDNCQVELDENRNVLYVHSPKGFTILRIALTPEQTVVAKRATDISGDRLDFNMRGIQ